MFKEARKALFWAKVQKSADSCWLWQASLDSKGYGQFGFVEDGKRINLRAHRVAYELVRGAIPPGLSLHHNCEVKSCVNPDHLLICTHQQNMTTGKWGRKQKPRCAQWQNEKTHCPKGHPLSGENLYVYPDGRRQCRACRRKHSLNWYYKTSGSDKRVGWED